MDWEFGVGRCKLLHLEWINDKVLLYSTGDYIQSLGINHKRKTICFKKKKCIYVDIYVVPSQLFFKYQNVLQCGAL